MSPNHFIHQLVILQDALVTSILDYNRKPITQTTAIYSITNSIIHSNLTSITIHFVNNPIMLVINLLLFITCS